MNKELKTYSVKNRYYFILLYTNLFFICIMLFSINFQDKFLMIVFGCFACIVNFFSFFFDKNKKGYGQPMMKECDTEDFKQIALWSKEHVAFNKYFKECLSRNGYIDITSYKKAKIHMRSIDDKQKLKTARSEAYKELAH
jgi:hypothetical protein